jgi:hypothetical protein
LQGLQKVGENKTVGQQHVWDQDHGDHLNKMYHQSYQKLTNNQNDKKDRRRPGWCRHQRLESPVAKPSTQLPSRRLWLHLNRFSSRQVQYCHPRAGFRERMTTQVMLPPHSRASNGGEDEKRSTSCPIRRKQLRRTFFCFREVKSELADLSLSKSGLMMNLDGVARIISKNESTADF